MFSQYANNTLLKVRRSKSRLGNQKVKSL